MSYDPHYYCEGCGKRLGLKSHDIVDRLGDVHYESMMCRRCEEEELAYLHADDESN